MPQVELQRLPVAGTMETGHRVERSVGNDEATGLPCVPPSTERSHFDWQSLWIDLGGEG
jgi:hypothetical protein